MRRNPRALLRALARDMRRHPTSGEQVAWEVLRDRRFLGLKFRRQEPVAGFIVDFYCRELLLVIEIDGAAHVSEESRARDRDRDQLLQAEGVQVLRMQDGPHLGRDFARLQATLLRSHPPLRLYGEGGRGDTVEE